MLAWPSSFHQRTPTHLGGIDPIQEMISEAENGVTLLNEYLEMPGRSNFALSCLHVLALIAILLGHQSHAAISQRLDNSLQRCRHLKEQFMVLLLLNMNTNVEQFQRCHSSCTTSTNPSDAVFTVSIKSLALCAAVFLA